MTTFRVLLESLDPEYQSLTLSLSPGEEVLVGRMATCHVRLPVPTISNIHLSVFSDASGAISIVDHSSNGCLLNGGRLEKRATRSVVIGDVVTLVRGSKSKAPMEFRVSTIEAVSAAGGKRRRSGPAAALAAPSSGASGCVITDRLCTDDYELGQVLGDGAFAVVHEAKHRRTGKSVAIKVIARNNPMLRGLSTTKLYEEFHIMRSLRHPHIPRTYDLYDSPKTICIVQELINGGELFAKMIIKQRFDEIKCRGLFRQICEGVAYVHGRGVVHRDLKPENILLQALAEIPTEPGKEVVKKYVVKITDFGMSSMATTSVPAADARLSTPVGPIPSASGMPRRAASGAVSSPAAAATAGGAGPAASTRSSNIRMKTQVGTPLYSAPEMLLVAPRYRLTAAALRCDVEGAALDYFEDHPSFRGLARPPPPHRKPMQHARQAMPKPALPVWCDLTEEVAADVCAIQDEGYTASVDSWSLGVILYVLLCGNMPFFEEERYRPQILTQNLLRFFDIVSPPWGGVSVMAKDLLVRLLDPSPRTRLLAADALKHPWLLQKPGAPTEELPMENVHPWLRLMLQHAASRS